MKIIVTENQYEKLIIKESKEPLNEVLLPLIIGVYLSSATHRSNALTRKIKKALRKSDPQLKSKNLEGGSLNDLMRCVNGNFKVDKKWQEAGAHLLSGNVGQAFKQALTRNTSKVDKDLTGKMFGKDMSRGLELALDEFKKELPKNIDRCKQKFGLSDPQVQTIVTTVINTMEEYLNRAQRLIA